MAKSKFIVTMPGGGGIFDEVKTDDGVELVKREHGGLIECEAKAVKHLVEAGKCRPYNKDLDDTPADDTGE